MLPKISGMDVLQQIRAQSTVPIIIMSAKDTDSDITLGLGLGADDYVTKPFSMVQVLARIKANLRRTGQYAASSPPLPAYCGRTANESGGLHRFKAGKGN